MNLIKQFPDISGKIRAKITRANKPVNAGWPLPYSEDPGIVAYDRGKFRRRNVKLFFIGTACMTTIYLALLNSPRILNYLRLAIER